MKLSIIVRVYGVENFVLDFAESLFPQLNENVELIIVDDGAKDNSILILKEYYNKNNYTRFNLIWLEQENQGQSVARNYGISKSTGDYITFLDPDDLVSCNYINQIISAIKVSPDLIQFNCEVFVSSGSEKNKINEIKLVNDNLSFILNEDKIIEIYSKKAWFSWLRVVKRQFIDSDFFPKNVNYQDMMAFPKLYKKVKNIKNIDENLVLYRVHSNSSVNSFKPKLLTSADFGLELYEKIEDSLDIIIYKQFLTLRMDLTMSSKGLKSALIWYYKHIYSCKNSLYYKNISNLNFYITKFTAIFCYRTFKNIFNLNR